MLRIFQYPSSNTNINKNIQQKKLTGGEKGRALAKGSTLSKERISLKGSTSAKERTSSEERTRQKGRLLCVLKVSSGGE